MTSLAERDRVIWRGRHKYDPSLGMVRYRGKLMPARSPKFTPEEQQAIAQFVAEKGVTRVPAPWDMLT